MLFQDEIIANKRSILKGYEDNKKGVPSCRICQF